MAILFTLFGLLLLSAFFSGSETALFSLSKVRVKRLQVENVKNAKRLAQLLNKPLNLIISILIGNMFVNILSSATASSLCLIFFGSKGLSLSIGIMTFLILTFGEITPKVIAIRNPEYTSLAVAPYIYIFSRIITPIRGILKFIVNRFSPLWSKRLKAQKTYLTQEELGKAVEIGRSLGVIDKSEEEMIKGVFKFGDKKACDVMVPLKRIVAVDIATPLDTIRSIITKKELSRMPIFENRLTNVIGILYAKDLIIAKCRGKLSLRGILRKPFYVKDSVMLDDLLREFRKHRIHMALVKDAKDKIIGLITLQDLLEEIIGQIRDIKVQSV